jgi:hypothetical protein
METTEHFAKISLVARQLGNENVFSPPRAQELVDARARYGVQAGAGCRIENNGATYAPEVPMTGNSNGGNKEVDLSADEVARLVRTVTERVLQKIN